MPKTTSSLETPLRAQLDKLAAFEPCDLPVISLYLDMQPDQHGRDQYRAFVKKAFSERQKTLGAGTPERESFDQDVQRITEYLAEEVERSANGLAIFACQGAALFETIQMTAPIDHHWLFVGPVPHLYPLARVNDQYPRYAALLLDTNAARLFVFSLGEAETRQAVQNTKTRRTAVGGWSQARYQRHVENIHEQHIKEVVEALDRVVREDSINHIVLSCDEVARPRLMEHLPKHLADKIVDVVSMDIKAPEHEIFEETLEALRAKDAETDQERVQEMIGAWRGGGLAVAGPEETLAALERAQVEELLIAASLGGLRRPRGGSPDGDAAVEVDTSGPQDGLDPERVKLAHDLVAKAHATAARIRFVEDPKLLDEFGGVGATLRFKIQPSHRR